jgi:hypothetical protein
MYASNALSEPATSTVVYPTGVYPDDPIAVQQAVDGGGTVILESVNNAGDPTAFNFGPPGEFEVTFLTVDVEILGVEGPVPTRIEGGYIPFWGVEHTTTRIENITFDGPGLTAVLFIYSTGVEFIDNHVTGVVGSSLGPITEGRGIKFLGNNDPAAAIIGDIEIIGNRFDNLHADLSDAIVFDAVAANTYIVKNEILDIGGAGILAIAQGGDMEVTRNTIIPGPGPDSEWDFGDGIWFVGGTGHFTITRNTILCENVIANPVWLTGNGSPSIAVGRIDAPVITQNLITKVGPSFGGSINIWGDVDNAYVANNRITGSSDYAIGILPWFGGESALGNTFLGNNLVNYEAAWAHTVVWSHASDTHVIGNGGSVFDIGHNTVITGEGPVAGEFAGGFSQSHKAAALKAVDRFLGEHRPSDTGFGSLRSIPADF